MPVCVCSWASERVNWKRGAWHCSEGCGKQKGSAGIRWLGMAGSQDPAQKEQNAYTVDPCRIVFCPFQVLNCNTNPGVNPTSHLLLRGCA